MPLTVDQITEKVKQLPYYDPELPLIISSDVYRANRCPPGQFLTPKWPVLHVGEPPEFDKDNWSLRLFGRVEQEVTLTYDDFLALPKVQVWADIHCVTRWSRLDNLWVGVQAREVVKLVNYKDDNVSVMLHGANDYTTNVPLKDFLDEDVVFVWKHNGEYIDQEHGFPLRLVVPKLYLWKGAKWVEGIEFMKRDKPGFWEIRGYHIHGCPWNEERYW